MSVGDYDSLDDLKTKLRVSLLDESKEQAEEAYEEQIWEKLFEVATVDYPQLFVDQEMDALQAQFEGQLQQQGVDLDTYLQLTNTTQEAWAEQMRPAGEERLKRNLVLGQVIQEEGLQVETEEIETEIEDMARPLGEQGDRVREAFASPMGKLRVTETLLLRKAMDRLKAIARGVESADQAQAKAAEHTDEQSSDAQGGEEAVQEDTEPASAPALQQEAMTADAEPDETASPEAELSTSDAEPQGEAIAEAAETQDQDENTPAQETKDPLEESA
jgi:FKBP-type peptidyl-prolyl cis-trans isomerase (trigger factor)